MKRKKAILGALLLTIGLGPGCDPQSATSEVVPDPGAVEAEVQRVFNDAACFCESYLIYPNDQFAVAPTVYIRTAHVASDARLLSYLAPYHRAGAEAPSQCELGAESPRTSVSNRTPSTTDLQSFACTGHVDTVSRAWCRAEFDSCLAHELELAASSATRPLPGPVRTAVLAEAARRGLSSAATGLAELTSRTSTCASTPTDPDCVRLASGYGVSLHQRTSDTVATSLSLADEATEVSLSLGDALTPGLVEGTGYGAAMWGPDSSRLSLLSSLYGSSVVGTVAPATPAPTATSATYTGVALASAVPPSLALNAFQAALIRVMPERENLLLASALTIGGTTLPAGTRINVYLAHVDPTAASTLTGTMTLDRPVLGVLQTDAELSASQALLVRAGLTYPSATGRGVEAGDSVVVTGTTVTMSFANTTTSLDEIRIVTLASLDAPEQFVSVGRGGDLPFAARLHDEDGTPRMVSLLAQHRIPLPHTSCVSPTTFEISNGTWTRARTASACGPERAETDCMYDELEAAIRLAAGRPGRVASDPYLLESDHGLRPVDIVRAVEYVEDARATMNGVVLAPALPTPLPTTTICGPSILRSLAPRPRSVLPTLAALARSGTGALAGSSGTSYYAATAAQLTAIGTTGASHLVRWSISQAMPADPTARAAAEDTLGLIDAEIGPSWTEWRVCDQASCDGDARWTARWSVFERVGTLRPAGVAVLVRSEADVECLLRGGEALAGSGSCAHVTGDIARYREMSPISTGFASPECTSAGALGAAPYCRRSFAWASMAPEAGTTDRRFVLWCSRTAPTGPCSSYELVDVIYTGGGPQVHAFGGDTAADVATALELDPENPAVPLYNVLGFAHDFVPPLENELTETGDGREDSWNVYLSQAERAADEASRLLEAARQHELEELAYDRSLEAELAAAALAQQEVVSGICGADTPEATCAVERASPIALGPVAAGGLGVVDAAGIAPTAAMLFPSEGGIVVGGDDAHTAADLDCETTAAYLTTVRNGDGLLALREGRVLQAGVVMLECQRWQLHTVLAQSTLSGLPQALVDEYRRGAGPRGGEFADAAGRTQDALIRSYQALEDLRLAVASYDVAINAAQNALRQLHVRYYHVHDPGFWNTTAGCYIKAGLQFIAAGVLAGVGIVTAPGGGVGSLLSWKFAAILAAHAAQTYVSGAGCSGLDDDQVAELTVLSLQGEAVLSVQATEATLSLETALGRSVRDLAATDGDFDDMAREVELARRRREIAERLAMSGLGGDPAWRAIHVVERRRAEAALTKAQRYAFVARRAIETRLAIDMTVMTADEPYVAAPAFWTNDVMSLSGATEAVPVGSSVVLVDVRAERISDYLSNLRSFIDGDPQPRPFSEGDDVQVLNLGEVLESTSGTTVPFVSRVLFECGSGELLAGGVPAGFVVADPSVPPTPCGVFDAVDHGGVARAIFPFAIPADLDGGYFGDRLAGGNYNHRIRSLAINLVGRALFDCESAARPTECYGDGNVPFSMRHEGATLLENWQGEQRFFAFEPGVITRARAIADERWLTNPLSGSDAAIIATYERSEWWGRPLAGSYVLEIESRPETNWRNLENVQVLLRYHYWTRQR